MSSTLHTLLRLREAARKETLTALRKAEQERDTQEARLADVRASVVMARASLDPTDPADLSNYHSFRLRQEMAERRESARLAQKDRELDSRRTAHVLRVRDELALSELIESREAAEALELTRHDARKLDEMASRIGARHDAA